ncbi:MAG: RNA polymerase sigma factor [Solirubrobacteraceae bacterium]
MSHVLRSDEQLVACVRAGDDAAFAEIVRRYEARLSGFARRLLAGTSGDPQDVVQDALARAYRALPRDTRPMALSAWLHCIVRNCVIDDRRRHVPEELVTELASPGSLSDRAEERHDFAAVIAEIGRLPDRQREALVLSVFEGRSYAEIAAVQGNSVAAVKALICRGRSALRLAA